MCDVANRVADCDFGGGGSFSLDDTAGFPIGDWSIGVGENGLLGVLFTLVIYRPKDGFEPIMGWIVH